MLGGGGGGGAGGGGGDGGGEYVHAWLPLFGQPGYTLALLNVQGQPFNFDPIALALAFIASLYGYFLWSKKD